MDLNPAPSVSPPTATLNFPRHWTPGNTISHSILINDFPGYPYPIELSRELARRYGRVTHVYTPSVSTTPTGQIAPARDDPDALHIEPIVLARPLNKHNLAHRFFQERAYGRKLSAIIRSTRPDVVISANCPLDANGAILAAAHEVGASFVYWVQDLLGVAARGILRGRIPVVGNTIGRRYEKMEAQQLRDSDAVVVLSDDFEPIVEGMGVRRDRITVIENWAPLHELPAVERSEWAAKHGYENDFVFLYAGSLGMKHNPALLANLARELSTVPNTRVVVLSQGQGASYLREIADREGLSKLDVLPYAPFSEMPSVFAAADVLVGILEQSAGVYSVPSKILAYLCARRPILASLPKENLAARILVREQAGIVVQPNDEAGFVEAAAELFENPAKREALAANGRAYAERTFRIEAIGDQFAGVISAALESRGRPLSPAKATQ